MAIAYLATRLVQKYALTPTVTDVVDELNIYLIPVVNPDGLAYTSAMKSHRDWNMNRALNAEKKHGVDVSTDYEAMSQLETQVLSTYSLSNCFSLVLKIETNSIFRPFGTFSSRTLQVFTLLPVYIVVGEN